MPNPTASIIILTYNNLSYTQQCVESVLTHTQEIDYELILVDNASSDGTQQYLRALAGAYPHVRILLNETNAGFARGNNLGASLASGESLVFLNNDTLVTQGWLTGLLRVLDNPWVGMVGPVTNSAGNEARVKVDYTQITGLDKFAAQYSKTHRSQSFEINMLAFHCVAIRRSVFDEIGPLDERFGIGMFEDDDYALRLKANGYKLLCLEDVYIHHWGSASFAHLGQAEYWQLFHHNLNQYEEKWGVHWQPHPNRLEFVPEQLRQLVDGMIALSAKAADYHQKLVKLQELVNERDQVIVEKDRIIAETWARFKERDTFLLRVIWRLSLILIPHGSTRERALNWLLRPLRAWRRYGSFGMLRTGLTRLGATRPVRALGKLANRLLPGSWKKYLSDLRQAYPVYDRSQVFLFTDDESLQPNYPHRCPLTAPSTAQQVKVSLIATVRDESGNIERWLESLLKQTRLPDEIVICDGGSTDGTAALLRQRASEFPIPIQVIDAPGANIARGRNIAIQHVGHEVIACTDFGCELDDHWLQNLVVPFERDAAVDVSCGFSHIHPESEFVRIAARYFIPEINTLDLQQFIPSARNFAMRKQVWEQADGFPEWLTFAGEDTLFALNAKLQASRWAFVPQATVYWQAPGALRRLYRTIYRYAFGDGEAGTFAYLYGIKIKELCWTGFKVFVSLLLLAACCLAVAAWVNPWAGGGIAGLAVLGGLLVFQKKLRRTAKKESVGLGMALQTLCMTPLVNLAQPLGFMRGAANRSKARLRQAQPYRAQLEQILAATPDRKGIIIYLPTHDWGFMFQRPHQMARAFAHQGYVYFFCTKNEKTDCVIGFRPVESGLYVCQVPFEVFSTLEKPIVYVGQPWRNHELHYFQQPRVIYDHFDEIEIFSADPADHQALLERAEIVLVTAQRLMDKVHTQRPDAIFAPNGVDYPFVQSAHPSRSNQPVPADLQAILSTGKPVIGYSGALAEWVDFDLLAQVAKARSDLEFVLLGVNYDGSLDRSGLLTCGLSNLHWLGMKPYSELFNYTWRFSAGIIPFKINQITLSTTPVKLFEYMACELPVIATAMPEARKYAGVFIAEDGGSFEQSAANFSAQIDIALRARLDPAYQALIRQVASENTWDQRVQTIIERLSQNTNA